MRWLLVALFVTACGGASSPDADSLPSAVVLRVDRVVVSPTRPGTSKPWDGAEPEASGAGCSLLSAVGSAVSPIVGKGAALLCHAVEHHPERERQPEDPDLQVRIFAGDGAVYASAVSRDLTDETFRYEIVVPSGAIPADGLRVEVVDDDAGTTPQPIGAVRLTRADVARLLTSPTHLFVGRDGGVQRLEIVASEYAPAHIGRTDMPAAKGVESAPVRSLFAGEIVQLAASGTYTVGSFYDEPIGPRGYPNDSAHRYNFEQEPFRSAPHACGIATVGTDPVEGRLVTPTRTFLTRVPGPLRFGVNDNDPDNNNGTISFEGSTRAPTPSEWLEQKARGSG